MPSCRQFIAITPRCGSTWWCDLLAHAGLGRPAEFLNGDGLWRKSRPTITPLISWAELHQGMACSSGTEQYDLKASWFQFMPLLDPPLETTLTTEGFPTTIWSYLTRRDLPAQALSLYLMRRVGSAHSRKGQAKPVFDATWFHPSPANHEALMCWLLHIVQQEYGWEAFFLRHSIKPWRYIYEDIAQHPVLSLRRYVRHADLRGVRRAELTLSPAVCARRATRRSRFVKRDYPTTASGDLLASFKHRFARQLSTIDELRGKEAAASLMKICAMSRLDRSEMKGL